MTDNPLKLERSVLRTARFVGEKPIITPLSESADPVVGLREHGNLFFRQGDDGNFATEKDVLLQMEVVADTVMLLNGVVNLGAPPRLLPSRIDEESALNLKMVRDAGHLLGTLREVGPRKQIARPRSVRSPVARA